MLDFAALAFALDDVGRELQLVEVEDGGAFEHALPAGGNARAFASAGAFRGAALGEDAALSFGEFAGLLSRGLDFREAIAGVGGVAVAFFRREFLAVKNGVAAVRAF